jgi:pSer/pThr/pTyr-binding forkhead associated (FHA) protein
MSELALFIVRTGFLVVLWIFVFAIISVIRADLFGQKVVSKVAEANAPKVVSAPIVTAAPLPNQSLLPQVTEPSGTAATKLVITAGDRAGFSLRLDRREITMGRADNSDLVIDDEYASTQHAKLVLINNDWLIQDLNSTNGTYLDGSRVGTPAVVKLNTPVRIGKTIFELRA